MSNQSADDPRRWTAGSLNVRLRTLTTRLGTLLEEASLRLGHRTVAALHDLTAAGRHHVADPFGKAAVAGVGVAPLTGGAA